MGDLRACSPEPNGVVLPNETAIGEEYWRRAEAATEGIINQVRPTVVSEERRKAVVDYVLRLIKSRVGCEVFPFGSVPLKTYLPDGDIDLTAIGGTIMEEALANKVCSVLEREDQNDAAEFVVKDVQLIRAEVKLVKCLVQNIVVDISFNQLGGLCTLCFLEQADNLIGKEHLLKRSIILIKAWCYYESRILGAHHGLISTYALETLVLYIFHLFNSSLNGPLAVLYKFLDYFSKFDWDNYCISLNGPVRISSLPEFVVVNPENGPSDLLLSNDYLKDCIDRFSVATRGLETNSRTFPPKHLNIVDPLKENNNLGRSVSKGNFFRIRSAFTYGARKLGRILSQPEENVADELRKFFANTLDRHGNGQRPDVQDHIPVDGQCAFGAAVQFQGMEYSQEGQSNSELASADSDGSIKDFKLDEKQSFYGRANAKLSRTQTSFSTAVNDAKNYAKEIAIAENRLSGDAKDLATAKTQGFPISRNHSSSAPSAEETTSSVGKAPHAPHLYYSSSALRNGEIRNGNPERKQREGSGSLNEKSVVHDNQDHSQLISAHEVMSPVGSANHPLVSNNSVVWPSEDLCSVHSNSRASVSPAESPDSTTSLADLCGDFESNLNSLHYSRWCYEYTHFPSMSHQMHSPFGHNAFAWVNVNGAVSRPYFPMNAPLIHGAGFGMEEMPKTRGTGTYFPNAILQTHYREKNSGSRGRNQGQMRSPRNNGRNSTPQETTSPEKISHDVSQTQYHGHQGGGKYGSSAQRHFVSAEGKPYYNVNGSVTFSEKVVDHGSVLPPSHGLPFVETSRHPGLAAPVHNSSISVPPAGMQKPKPVLVVDQDSISLQSYRLKDDGDFPPLSDSSGKGSPVSTEKKVEKAEQ